MDESPTKSIAMVLAVLLLLMAGCSKDQAPRYLFLITLDTTRADFVNYALEGNNLTPNFARLAAKGVVFENAYSLIPITLPSHTSIFYSMPPHRLKVFNNGDTNRASEPALAQLLQKEDFQTGAVVSLGVLRAEAGLNHGFDQYLENFRPNLWYRNAAEVNADVMRQVREFKQGKAFFWIHYSDPHGPYFTPDYPQKFRAFFNGNEVLSGRSTDQFMVDLDLELLPGLNKLNLRTEIPLRTLSGEDLLVKNIAYMNFNTYGVDEVAAVEMHLPRRWNRVEQRRGKVTYFAKDSKSRIVLINRDKEPRRVKISFLLQLHLDYENTRLLYREEMVYMDREFGRLVSFLKREGLYKDSAFVVMGDHGEGLGEIKNGHVGHIHYLNRVYSHVPLFIAGKGIKGPARRKELVSNLDIAPTVLGLAGVAKAPHMQGTSLLDAAIPQRRLLLATYTPEAYLNAFSLLEFPYQLIYTPERPIGERMEFLHLLEDAFGGTNLFRNPTVAPQLKTKLVNAVRELAKVILQRRDKPGTYSKRQEEILKSLGYL